MIGRFKIVEKFVIYVVIAHVTFRNDYVCLHAFVNNLKYHPLRNKNIFDKWNAWKFDQLKFLINYYWLYISS